jgi:hypothetical protein
MSSRDSGIFFQICTVLDRKKTASAGCIQPWPNAINLSRFQVEFFVPKGHTKLAHQFIGGNRDIRKPQVPKGRLKKHAGNITNISFSIVPCGTWERYHIPFPRDESLGYFRFVPSGLTAASKLMALSPSLPRAFGRAGMAG